MLIYGGFFRKTRRQVERHLCPHKQIIHSRSPSNPPRIKPTFYKFSCHDFPSRSAPHEEKSERHLNQVLIGNLSRFTDINLYYGVFSGEVRAEHFLFRQRNGR